MKICIISNANSIHTQRWAQYFADNGNIVSVITPPAPGGKIVNISKVNVIVLKSAFHPSASYLRHKIGHLFTALEIHKLVKDISPDITHLHSLDYIHPLLMALVNLALGRLPNLIISTWGSDAIPNHTGAKFSLRDMFSKRLLLRQAKEITATSKILAEYTAMLAPRNKTIHVIPFGVDLNRFSPKAKKASGTITIGFIKHLSKKYGPEYLVRAMVIIARHYPDTRLIMAGEGMLEQELRSLSQSLGLEKNIEFTGKIPYDKIPDILAQTDISVMPSISESESFGVAAVEASAMEIPVVATRVGGIPEVVVDGKTGILIEPRNSEELARAVIRLIADPKLREEMGKQARQFVMDNYDWQNNARSMERVYEGVLDARVGDLRNY